MNKIYRILISVGVAIALMFLTVVILVFLNKNYPIIIAFVTLTAFSITYKLIPASKKESDRKNTTLKEVFHENGVLKETGELFHDKRVGEWPVFDKQGAFIKTEYYEDGVYVSSKKAS